MRVRRFAGREDVPGIIRVNGRAWREAYADLLPEDVLSELTTVEPTDEEVDRWLESLRENADYVLVAVEDGDVVGYADFRWDETETKSFVDDGEAGLKAIYVDPDYWGEGVGTALLDAGIERLPDEIDTLRLETLSGNEAGKRFYEARDFKRTGTSEFELAGERYPTDVYTLQPLD